MMSSPEDISPDSIKSFNPGFIVQLLGTALVVWETVEDSTFRLFQALLRTDDLNISRSVFFTAGSYGMKLKMVDNLLRASVHDESINTNWADLRPKIEAAARLRDTMARWLAAPDFDDETWTMDLALLPVKFRPATDQDKTLRLIRLADEFSELSHRIGALTRSVAALA